MDILELTPYKKNNDICSDTFVFVPNDNDIEELYNKGFIFIVGLCRNFKKENQAVLLGVSSVIFESYYSKNNLNQEESFYYSLNKLNNYINKLRSSFKVPVEQNLSLGVVSLTKQGECYKILFSKKGAIKIFIKNNEGEILDVSENFEDQNDDKILGEKDSFLSNIGVGSVLIDNILFVMTTPLFDLIKELDFADKFFSFNKKSDMVKWFKINRKKIFKYPGNSAIITIIKDSDTNISSLNKGRNSLSKILYILILIAIIALGYLFNKLFPLQF